MMTGRSGDFEDEGDESEAILTTSRRRRAPTELERFHLGTSHVNRYEGEVGDDADQEAEASQAEDGSTPNVGESGHSTREFED